MAQSFIGKPISLISHSDVRYRGILAGIDPAASTIQLSNVFSMGTETRRPPAEFIPPVQEPYQYIIFRASEVKDLAVDEPTPRRSVHDDPAVLAAPPQAPTPTPPRPQQPQPQPKRNPPNSVHTAAASLETVERALGDLRVSTTRGRGRGGAGARPSRHTQQQLTVPTTDFDFESMNAKFDKAALGPGADEQPNGVGALAANASPATADTTTSAYDPAKSFFDTLSPVPLPRRRGPGGPVSNPTINTGAPRSRREEERERNVATFGEPGGYGGHGGVGGYYAGVGVGGYHAQGAGRRRGRAAGAAAR
ncbi:hypothetical protein E4T56_gene19892 [Termitomyces sp. T112]|nr:hypothetical protein E4T56_gene19892 [Termitomyces sp. T112]